MQAAYMTGFFIKKSKDQCVMNNTQRMWQILKEIKYNTCLKSFQWQSIKADMMVSSNTKTKHGRKHPSKNHLIFRDQLKEGIKNMLFFVVTLFKEAQDIKKR